MTQEWVKDWQAEEVDITPKLIGWMRSRPDSIKELMLKFPPQCLVRATRELRCPAPDTVGIVFSYLENGSVTVIQHPQGDTRAQCQAGWLEVVGYRKGLTPNDMRSILEGDD